MAPKSLLVVAALLAVVVSACQLPRGATALEASPSTNTNTSLIVSGTVPCATGNSIDPATVPAFPNALVQLVCGGKVVGSATADSAGAFVFSQSSASRDLVAAAMHNLCRVVVVTPLGACDRSLAAAAGTLSAPLKLVGITTGSGSGSDLGGLGGLIGGIVGLIGAIVGGILNLSTMPFSFV
ncbi:uncharacterized protein LOC107521950 precursor [Zea mays]|uniref:Phylloplanin n=1 Tax=Zea mays TaxID=4577 RepID=A0A096UAQ8_MAIZE|nr:uncharacterized protein LOC107521950 precursor [Zea mays]ONL97914.1 hypothetical protein ZEAMMB73_Zm00001d029099 [Zea mays]|eukprot:NP_001308647.1 uncharacterized protein LOC107521950 precursor [Zea mays]